MIKMTKAEDTQKLISSNNDLRKKLNPTNEKYYSKLLIYVRTSGLLYEDYEVESSLLEILQDILDAQNNGQDAQDYFGQEPSKIANQLINNFTKISFKQQLKFFGTLFGVTVIWTFITQLIGHEQQLNLMPFILNGVFLILFIAGTFWFIHQTTYWKLSDHKIFSFLFTWIVCMAVITIFTGIQFVKPAFLNIPVTPTIIVSLNLLLLIASLVALIKIDKNKRPLMIAISPIIWVLTTTNILKTYLPIGSHRMITLVTAILIFLSCVWFFVCFWRVNRQQK